MIDAQNEKDQQAKLAESLVSLYIEINSQMNQLNIYESDKEKERLRALPGFMLVDFIRSHVQKLIEKEAEGKPNLEKLYDDDITL